MASNKPLYPALFKYARSTEHLHLNMPEVQSIYTPGTSAVTNFEI